MVIRVCAHMSRKLKKLTVDFMSLESAFGKVVLKIAKLFTLRS